MRPSAFRIGAISLSLVAVAFLGCAGGSSQTTSRRVAYIPPTNYIPAGAAATHRARGSTTVARAGYGSSAGSSAKTASGAGYAATGRTPVDLPTVMRLVSGRNLDINMVRQELRESHADLRYAKRWWLPNVSPTLRYQGVDGNDQPNRGGIIRTNRTNAFAGAGIYGDWEVGESIFLALAARRRTSASEHAVQSGINDATLHAALAYFDLLRNQMALGIADEILQLYEGLVKETAAQVKAGGGFRGDELRARARRSHATVRQRKADEAMRVSAVRLREILNLPSDVELYASEGQVAQLEFIPADVPAESLIQQAMVGRPELREAKMLRAAAHEERRRTTVGPWIPNVSAGYEVGGFGTNYTNLGDRETFGVGLRWTIGRDGIGGKSRQQAAVSRERQWIVRQQKIRQRVVREVTEAQAEAQARAGAITAAKLGLEDAQEALGLYAKRVKIGVGIPLDAIVAAEVLNDSQLDYLDAVVGYNKAQMKLLRAVGRRPDQALGAAPAGAAELAFPAPDAPVAPAADAASGPNPSAPDLGMPPAAPAK